MLKQQMYVIQPLKANSMNYLRWIGRLVRPYGLPMTFMMLCHLLLAFCSVAFVYICKRLVDTAVSIVSGSAASDDILYLFIFMAAIVLIRIALNAFRTYVQTKTEIKMKNTLRRRLFDILLRIQTDGSRKYHSGDIINRLQEDVRVVSSAYAVSLPNLIGTVLQFIAALGFLLYLDIRLALIVVIVVPLGVIIGKYVSGRVRNLTHAIRDNDSKVQSHIQESIQHITLLQSLEYAQTSASELNDLQGELLTSEVRRTRFAVISRIFISMAFQAGYLIAFMWGVLGISKATVTYGMMTAFLQLVGQVQRPLLEMSTQIPTIIHSTASVDRILEIEQLPQETSEDARLFPGTAGIKLENVTFAYPDGDSNVLDRFSYDFVPGSRTSVVGPTGIGKSTLIRILLSLLKPQSGHINIYTETQPEGVPVSATTRCNLVYVPQGNSLFSGTIRDNLLMGNPEATEKQMCDALHIAAADFVLDLPDGLDSQCFEAGGGLSEGQAQRVAIARALLRPGSILLLDEFSSALDMETETILMQRLTSSLPDHTMIFITHREKIIDFCDSVLRM